MSRFVVPALVLLGLCGGITALFLTAEPESSVPTRSPAGEAASNGGPLVVLGPYMRKLPGGPDGEITARTYVRATIEALPGSRREPILEALAHADWGAQWAGLLAVPDYGPPDEALGLALRPLLSAPESRVRRLAATAAAFVGEGYDALEPLLVMAVTDVEAEVRAEALATLARRSPRAQELWAVFTAALTDVHGPSRAAAAKGLARIELQEALPPEAVERVCAQLRHALEDPSADVRMYSVMALGRAGSQATSEVDAIIALLNDPNTLVRGTAANALGDVGLGALPAIGEALAVETGAERASSLLWALRLIGEPALPTLEGVLTHPRVALRVQAALKLWELDQPPARTVAVLVEALAGDDLHAQRLAARGLGRMGTAGAGAKAALEGVRDHEDEVVRTAARAALARWAPSEDK